MFSRGAVGLFSKDFSGPSGVIKAAQSADEKGCQAMDDPHNVIIGTSGKLRFLQGSNGPCGYINRVRGRENSVNRSGNSYNGVISMIYNYFKIKLLLH